jgi:osmotically inducible protein OsmC
MSRRAWRRVAAQPFERRRGSAGIMQTPTDVTRTASVHWEGDVSRGKGTVTAESGFVTADYSFGTRFSGDPGTNPEELLAASHAACYTMALSLALTRDGHPPTSIDTKAAVLLRRDDQGVMIPRIDLTTTVTAPGVDADEFQRLAKGAKENCPISRALHAVEIELDARLNP